MRLTLFCWRCKRVRWNARAHLFAGAYSNIITSRSCCGSSFAFVLRIVLCVCVCAEPHPILDGSSIHSCMHISVRVCLFKKRTRARCDSRILFYTTNHQCVCVRVCYICVSVCALHNKKSNPSWLWITHCVFLYEGKSGTNTAQMRLMACYLKNMCF